jgi:anti-sigma factor RsiW
MHTSDQRLAAYLAGELDPDAARAVDEHLLGCDRCWHTVTAAQLGRRAAERLRQPTPPGLADRIRLAIQLAPDTAPAKRRRSRWAVAAAGAAALVAAAVVLAALFVPQLSPRTDSPVITALVHIAEQPGDPDPAMTQLGGQRVELRRYPVNGTTALVATSTQAFPTPADAQLRSGSAMAWTITRGPITVYCPHSQVLLAGPVPAATLAALAARLHLA